MSLQYKKVRNLEYMEIPFGNIFQVTINSNKLYTYIEDIITQLRDHNQKINELNSNISGITNTINQHIKMKDYNVDIQLQKMRKANQEEVNYVRLFMRDVDSKASDKINQMENTVQFLNNKMIKLKQTIEDDVANKLFYFDQKLNTLAILKQDQEKIKQEIMHVKECLVFTNFKIQKISANMQEQLQKNVQLNGTLMERISHLEKENKNQNPNIEPMIFSIVEDNTQSKSKRRKQKQEERQSQIFSNIINKIDEVQHTISKEIIQNKSNIHQPRRSLVSNNKIVKSNTNIINQLQKNHYGPKTGGKFKEFQNLVMEKLVKLQSLSVQKFELFQKEICKVTNKNDIIDEHIGILSRKIDKEKFKITEVTENMKRFDDKRIDEKTIENLKNMIKKLSKDTEEMLETKLAKDVYDKQKQKNIEKMQFLNQFIIEKAQKSEVKKGLAFLEEKIKEIIIVLAEERGSGQDGAMKKMPYKCLSCDKDLQVDRQESIARITPKQNTANITRCNTNQLRKRIRMINNTITTSQKDD